MTKDNNIDNTIISLLDQLVEPVQIFVKLTLNSNSL